MDADEQRHIIIAGDGRKTSPDYWELFNAITGKSNRRPALIIEEPWDGTPRNRAERRAAEKEFRRKRR